MWRKLAIVLIVVPLGVVLVALAVINRKPVELVLDPFGGPDPSLTLEAPFFLFLLGAFALGLIVGGIATWFKQGKWRKTARTRRREADEWHTRADKLEQELEELDPAHHPRLPAN
ncbi:MAG: lipopolysaccharide assembly protein LapA domain-containing protein [Methyloceanibacter sp.]